MPRVSWLGELAGLGRLQAQAAQENAGVLIVDAEVCPKCSEGDGVCQVKIGPMSQRLSLWTGRSDLRCGPLTAESITAE